MPIRTLRFPSNTNATPKYALSEIAKLDLEASKISFLELPPGAQIAASYLRALRSVPELKQATGAPTAGYHVSAVETFEPDIKLSDGDIIAGMTTSVSTFLRPNGIAAPEM